MKLERAITVLNAASIGRSTVQVNSGLQLLVTLGFIVAVVTVPLDDPGRLVWFFCFPIVMSEALRLGYSRIFMQSLWLLPLIAFIGIFNPILDRETQWIIGGVAISRGWVSFISIILRGLLSVQALLVLVKASGFNDICRSLAKVGVPSVLVTQLLMLYRFLIVLLQEALTMHRARQSRGFGRKNYPLKMWGTFCGQLLMRSIDRANRINRAMQARGYTGSALPSAPAKRPVLLDWIYLISWTIVILSLRFLPLTVWFARFFES